MKASLIIRNKYLYKIWFINFIGYLGANPDSVDKTLSQINENEERYFKNLFKVGNIKPKRGVTTQAKVFQAHLEGIKIVGERIKLVTSKYPEVVEQQFNDPSWIRFVADRAEMLAGEAAAACNSQANDEGGPFDDPDRCVDAWIDYDNAIRELEDAKEALEDCLRDNPPPDTAPEDKGPFSGGAELDPCQWHANSVVLAENNMNAAWDDIRVWC